MHDLLSASQGELADVMERMFDECRALRGAGQKEYAGGENAFGNFVRLAVELDSTPEKVLWTYAMKHKDGIAAHIRGHTSQREPVRGRIKDLIVYLCILAAMDEKRERMRAPIPVLEHGDALPLLEDTIDRQKGAQ